MTDFYKNNDNLLRDKLTQHEFAQTPNAWENMSALLDQHPVVAKRAAGYWWSVPFVTAAALAGVIGLGMHFAPNQTQAMTTNGAITQQNPTESALPQAPKVSKQLTALAAPIQELKQLEQPLVEAKQNKIAATAIASKKTTVKKKATTKQTLLTAGSSTTNQKNPAILSVVNVSAPTNKTQEVENTSITTNLTSLTKNKKTLNTKRRVKTTRTEIIYQYSTTPLRALQEKRRLMEKQKTIGTFGIGDELNIKKSPLKVSIFGGASAKLYRSTKDFSVMPFAGVSASYRIAKHHGIRTGVQYKSMGNLTQNSSLQLDSGTGIYSNTATIKRIDLLEIPLVYQFHPHPKYNIQTGVKGAWLMNTETTNPELNNLSNAEMGISDFDFSLLLGMEYCFNDHWAVGVQYSLGLINLTKGAADLHQEEVQATMDAEIDPQYNIQSLDDNGELMVPVSTGNVQNQSLKVPNQLRNNDVQLLLKYTF
ncbi:MAG: PorT family protein [Aureispira sp.]|nr:PorT family protein [Aureispira sp.]